PRAGARRPAGAERGDPAPPGPPPLPSGRLHSPSPSVSRNPPEVVPRQIAINRIRKSVLVGTSETVDLAEEWVRGVVVHQRVVVLQEEDVASVWPVQEVEPDRIVIRQVPRL